MKFTSRFSESSFFSHKGLTVLVTSTLILALPGVAPADDEGRWIPQGPSPLIDAQVENVVPDNEADGAIQDVVAHPTDPNIFYAATVNGGIWKTTDATALRPTWTNQTDGAVSSSFGAITFDPTDAMHRTLVAGFGLTSSFGRAGTTRAGLLRTTNGGAEWKPIDGGGTLLGKNVDGLAARGDTLVVAVNIADSFTFGNIGIFRSTDGGASFAQVSGAPGSGLPPGTAYDLVGDPNRPARLFTATIFSNLVGATNGFYRSDDTGATWAKVSDAAIDAQMAPIGNTNSKVEFAVGNANNVYAVIVNNGRATGVFRSGDGGDTWTQMDLPATVEGGGVIFGIHPGGQGGIHLSIAADPSHPNLVYLAGDRQPFFTEGAPGTGPFFPNSIGAVDFSGRLFRGDASRPSGSQWAHLTHSTALGAAGGGTASDSSPHADSREMTFDAAGNLIESDDGGIYKRTRPHDNTGDWFSLNGSLQVTELHDHAYDANVDVLLSGNQDNGTSMQEVPGELPWGVLLGGDGGDAAVDDKTLAAQGISMRYSSSQFLGNFVVTFWDQDNQLIDFFFPPRTVVDGGSPFVGQFSTPFVANEADGTRLLFAGGNSLYESLDQGVTLREIGPGVVSVGTGRNPLAYGHPDDPDVIYAGNVDSIVVRRGGINEPLLFRTSFPGTGTGFTIRGIAIDPDDVDTAYVATAFGAFLTRDAGETWTDITANLTDLALLFLRGAAFIPRADDDDPGKRNAMLVVSASNGVFFSRENKGFTNWKPLGTGMPTVGVYDLDYDAPTDTLTAGTLGRGAFRLEGLGGRTD